MRRRLSSPLYLRLANLAGRGGAVERRVRQNYPNRPVVIVVPFAAGGAFDVLARVLAPRMARCSASKY